MNLPANYKNPLLNIISFVVIGLLLLNVVFYMLQPGMLFYPYKTLDATPANWGLRYENVELITSDNIKLHGWYLPKKNAKQVMLFFHGNGGNISHRGATLKIFHELGLNVLIIDYRGYGLSGGKLSEKGLYLDAKAAWQYLIEQQGFLAQDIIIFGRSLGAAIAIQLASQVKPGALIIESALSSVSDMANKVLPLISKLIYLRYKFDAQAMITRVNVPVLIMHSPDDEIIPFQQGQKLFSAANNPKHFYQLHGSHNNGFLESMPGYQQVIKEFLRQ